MSSFTEAYKKRLAGNNAKPVSSGASFSDRFKSAMDQNATAAKTYTPSFKELSAAGTANIASQRQALAAFNPRNSEPENRFSPNRDAGVRQSYADREMGNRVGNFLSGTAKQYVSGFSSGLSTMYEAGTRGQAQEREREIQDLQRRLQLMDAGHQDFLKTGKADASYMKEHQEARAALEAQIAQLQTISRAQTGAVSESHKLADQLAESGSEDLEKAKTGLGSVGRFAVDVGAGAAQLGADVALGVATGGGTMVPLALRSFGGGAQEARNDGATIDQQVAYGAASALTEVLTEKIFSVGKFQTKAFGKGTLDDIMKGVVAAVEDAGKTKAGKAVLNRVASIGVGFLSEGLEEAVSTGVVNPILQKGIYGKQIDLSQVARDTAYDFLVGGAIGGLMGGAGGTDVSDVRRGRRIRESGGVKALMEAAQTTDKDSDAYKMADEIRSNRGDVTDAKLGRLAETVSRQLVSELIDKQKSVAQAQEADLGKPVVAETATVLDRGTSAYLNLATTAAGVKKVKNTSIKKAQEKAGIVQKLIDGEKLDNNALKPLNLTDPAYRAIFTELTGVQFPAGVSNPDALFNLARTAHEVAEQRKETEKVIAAAQKAAAEAPVVSEASDTAEPVVAQNASQEPAYAEDQLPTFEEFSELYRAQHGEELTPEQVQEAYDQFVAFENETVTDEAGTHTRMQFRSEMKASNQLLSDPAIDEFFNFYRDAKAKSIKQESPTKKAEGKKTESKKDLRHKLSKDVQNVIAAFEKKLGVEIHVGDEAIAVELTDPKTGKKYTRYAEGEHNRGSIRLNMNSRADLSYDEAVLQLLRHEMTHFLQAASPDTYKKFRDFVVKNMPDYQSVFDRQAAKYSGVIDESRKSEIDDEVVAKYMEKLFDDKEFVKLLAEKEPNALEWLIEQISNLISKLTGKDLAGARSVAEQTRDMWESMLHDVEQKHAKGEIKQGRETTVVDGKQYSFKSMSHDIREGTMYADLVKPQTLSMLGMKKSDVDKLFRQLNSLLKYMEPNLSILDYNEEYSKDDRPYHPYKQNSDPLYKISLDFSTMCTKRLLMQHIIERLQVMEQKPMSAARQMAIREKIKQYAEIEKGLQVACAMCYVESARLHSPEQVQHYLDNPGKIVAKHFSFKNKDFNAAVKEMQTEIKRKHGFNPNASKGQLSKAAKEEFRSRTDEMRENYKPSPEEQAIVDTANSLPVETYLTAENLTVLSREHPEIYDAFTTYIRNATRSKSTQTPVPYYYGDSKAGDVTVSDSFIESMNAENGMRFSSWSDYMFKHVLDMMTAVIELSVRGSSMHGYTKFPQFVRVFGKTGMMFNLSGVADGMGLDENGKLVFSSSESVDIAEARKVRNQYPETAGVQCIGVSDAHIRKLMATDWIDYIIPYHVSGMSAALRRLAGIAGWSDYSDVQHAKPDPKAKKHGKEPVFSEFFVSDNPGDGLDCMRKSAEKYKQLCAERGLIPKFNDFADDPNYWKLLIDRKMINQRTGALIFQKPVKPIFNFREIRKQVRQEVANYDPQREQRVFDYIVEHMDEVDAIAENVQAEMKAGAKGIKAKAEELGNEMTATAVNGDGQSQYSIADEKPFNLNPTEDDDFRYSFADDENRGTMEPTEQEGFENGREAEVYRELGLHHGRLLSEGSRGGTETARQGSGRQEIRYENLTDYEQRKVNEILVSAVDRDPVWRSLIRGLSASEVAQHILDGYADGERFIVEMQEQIPGFAEAMERAVDFATRGKMNFERRPGVPETIESVNSEVNLQDADYLAAVERGDMETAQRMVDAAAKAAGYNIRGYHGTDKRFTEFKIGDVGYHIGTEAQAKDRVAGVDGARILPLYAKIRNALSAAFDFGDWKGKNVAEMLIETEQWEEGYHEGAEEINARLEEISKMPNNENTDRVLREYLQSLRYDGIVYENQFEAADRSDSYFDGEYDDSYIVFDSSQLKLAAPVTYDDNGNVIPLSKRFDSSNVDIRYSFSDDLTPELREEFVKSFDAQFGEGAAEAMFKTHEQMVRAARRAGVRAKSTEESAAAERALAKRRLEDRMTAWEIHHKKTLREQQRKYDAKIDQERKAKAEAVADTKLVERAKADIRVQATEMNLGKKAAERESELKHRMAEQKEKAAERLRITKDAYKGKLAERTKLQRTAAKRLLSDKRAVEKRRAEIETQQGPVDTIRKNPRERVKIEKLKAAAEELRTRGRTAYRYFVNQAQEIDNFAKRQRGGVYASTLVNVLGGSNATVETIFKDGLVDRAGNRIAGSLKEVLLCMDATGKKVDEAKQALLQDYILHLHNVDRMSFVAKARARLDAFESNPEHAWLVNLDSKELAKLVAATDAETADAIFKKNGVAKGKKGWTEADRQLAWEYASLLKAFREANDKPVFADANGNPVTAETSREIVVKYEADHPWLVDKANGVFEWWDLFMRNWAVGDSLSLAEYETMHETYPHYAPTYRVDKGGPGGAVSISGKAATVSKATKAAKGSTREIVPIEDSFANIASKIVRMARVNELYTNIIDTAMLDDEGLFSDMAVFDWDWQTGAYEQALQIQAVLNGETAAEIEDASKVGLEKDGANFKLTGWKDGRKYSAYISEALYQSIADTTGATDGKLKTLTQIGNTLTGPMKTAITGVNPFFAIRNLSRDIPSAIINSTGGKFPKYWAQAIAEMKSNSANWQTFKALGGINAGYYNNEKGFAGAMSQGPGIMSQAVDKLGWVNNVTEAATRFAEYLSTIDRMGDTYEARLQGIKNSAEVTVDFSRKGSYGKFINAWVPYWNPAVQGIDKLIRSVVDSPDGSPVWKQATKTLSRAALCTVLAEAVLQAVLHGLDRDDEWEELSDRDKATYYCIPIPLWDEHKFLKIAKNREWGAILGTPFMLILEGLDGRQNPFENYVETSLEPNFMPGAILRPREGGGFTSDIIGVSQALDLAYNEDFAGRTIVPYAQQQGSLTEQYDSETSMFSRVLGDLINFSPMQLDYIIQDYFGDFGDVFTSLTAPSTWSGDSSIADTAASVRDTFTGSFFADNRYSNQTVSNYYETLDELGKVVNDKKNQMGTEAHKQTKEYKTQKGLQELYGDQITMLNKEVRGLPDGPDKDALKEEIARLAGLALEFYKESMSGAIAEPQLTAAYANLPSSVSNELIRLDSFAADYTFEPSDYKPSKYTDPKDKKREYVLDGEAQDRYRALYDATYAEVMEEEMNKTRYQKANDQKKVEMLEEARDSVTELTKERFLDWLADNRRSTEKTK